MRMAELGASTTQASVLTRTTYAFLQLPFRRKQTWINLRFARMTSAPDPKRTL